DIVESHGSPYRWSRVEKTERQSPQRRVSDPSRRVCDVALVDEPGRIDAVDRVVADVGVEVRVQQDATEFVAVEALHDLAALDVDHEATAANGIDDESVRRAIFDHVRGHPRTRRVHEARPGPAIRVELCAGPKLAPNSHSSVIAPLSTASSCRR